MHRKSDAHLVTLQHHPIDQFHQSAFISSRCSIVHFPDLKELIELIEFLLCPFWVIVVLFIKEGTTILTVQ